MSEEVYQHTLPNGMTLLAERMEHVRSAAMNFLVPAGCVYDPPEHLGIGAVLADLITRGAGTRARAAPSISTAASADAENVRPWPFKRRASRSRSFARP